MPISRAVLLAYNAVALHNPDFGQIVSQCGGCHLAQLQGCPRRCVFFHPMMGLDNLHIIGIAENSRCLFH